MKKMRLHIGLTSLVTAMFLSISNCATAQDAGSDTPPLFASHSIMDVRIEAPLTTLLEERPEEDYLDGRFAYTESDGSEQSFDLKLRTRGRYRRQKKTCSFPPVRLNFPRKQVEGSEFDGQDKLKLVTHCQTRRSRFEQHVLREFLTYRILQTLTDASFGTRLMRITWVDTEGGETISRYGFIIEDQDDIGKRVGLEMFNTDGLKYEQLDPQHTNLINVFQFMVGNTDFSLIRGPADDHCCHNAIPFTDGTVLRSIPYDFDFSGLVNAPYAKPNPQFKIRSVRKRVYRGRCSNNDFLQGTLDQILGKKAEIYALVDGLGDLDSRSREQVTRYLDEFFDIASNPGKADRALVKKCS